MASSPLHRPFGTSSPLNDGGWRRSQFTYRQFSQLASSNTSNPLRVIAHIDLDAFYAQCEMVRLGIPEDKPLAVQQWQGLIAINYAAREYGIGRHCNIEEAKKLCPELIAQHVATWREGDDKWAYREDAAANIVTDKVSLDPYRLQSRKILACIKEALPAGVQKVEKASIDEVFLDLSSQVYSILLERFPELSNPPPYDDPTEKLPLPSIAALDWQTDALIDLDEEQETIDPDWDDVAILIGSEIVRKVRSEVRQKLGYTCSAGVASNKLLSKLGSAYKKPNKQTVVRNRAVSTFMAGFKVTKLRNLGGKLGEQIVSTFNTENVIELLNVPLSSMKTKLGHDTGFWVFNTIRGIDTSEVNPRTQIKSMLSAKSFRPTINSSEQATRWLRIFTADIFARLVEEGVLENKRRPRTMNLHHRHEGQVRSRQAPIYQGRVLDEECLFELAKDLLSQIIAEGRGVWPCANLSLSVGGFEDGVKGNMGIGAFLVKGEEAEALRSSTLESRPSSTGPEPFAKKRRVEDNGIQRFFSKKSSTEHGGSPRNESTTPNQSIDTARTPPEGTHKSLSFATKYEHEARHGSDVNSHQPNTSMWHASALSTEINESKQLSIDLLKCSRCNASFADPEALQSHEDWHMAKDLQDEERVKPTFAERQSTTRNSAPKTQGNTSRRGRGGKLEQGQSRLKFG
ncbi:DNA polymerase eta subunit [Fusarium longipes]|uniref:DNA polymerase eta n=1 Tax=Fusarium longipes TaxID=694270 RepID=A0A395T851_9HYPO|nr:DNA polymerase eta subunit [Fusarium longipes]